MTMKDLEELFYLEKLIQHEKEQLEELRSAAGLKSPVLTDMPHAPGAKDRIGEIVPKIVDQTTEIEEHIRQHEELRASIIRFINGIPNARINLIFRLRFIDKKHWEEIADFIGGNETGESARKAATRYLELEAMYSEGE